MNPLKAFCNRLHSLWRRQATKREIDEELRLHISQRTTDNIADGMAPEDAAREARKRFGNWQNVCEECRQARGASLGESVLQDARFALRMLWKNPGFAAVAGALHGAGDWRKYRCLQPAGRGAVAFPAGA